MVFVGRTRDSRMAIDNGIGDLLAGEAGKSVRGI